MTMQIDSALELTTPCFVFEEDILYTNLSSFQKNLSLYWGNNTISSLSVKTLPIPWVLQAAKKLGCYAEVTSEEEYLLSLNSGYCAEEIVFNGPIKTQKQLNYALLNKSIVNLDSQRELRWTKQFCRENNVTAHIGLRVNIGIEELFPGELTVSPQPSRFGFSYENGSLRKAINYLQSEVKEKVVISGLQFHFSTKDHLPQLYQYLAKTAGKIADEFSLGLDYIDLGGGYLPDGENGIQYSTYCKAICEELSQHFDPDQVTLIVEPGEGVLNTVGCYIGKVIDKKDIGSTRFVITELSNLNLNPHWRERALDIELSAKGETIDKQILCGYTCMESDRIAELHNKAELSEGDVVIVHRAGAYTLSFSPDFFIKRPPSIYVQNSKDNSLTLIRE